MNELKAVLLAAGYGTRLKPLTDIWPKCLMPINGTPLLEYWVHNLSVIGVDEILINTHYRASDVRNFLKRPHLKDKVRILHEEHLLGTCGTLRVNSSYFSNAHIIVGHADNWCHCDFKAFINHHFNHDLPISMMTFTTSRPEHCGILKINEKKIVTAMQEKVSNPSGNTANAAVYIFRPEVLDWIKNNKFANDISVDVLPYFMGRISSWHNAHIHRDIGTINELKAAQKDTVNNIPFSFEDVWQSEFKNHPIHSLI